MTPAPSVRPDRPHDGRVVRAAKEAVMSLAKVILGGPVIPSTTLQKLEKAAAAVAESITIPSGVEFARFEDA